MIATLNKQDADVKRFAELVTKGIECWLEAGKIVAAAMEKDPTFADKCCEQIPGLSREVVYRFELIGLGQVLPQSFLNDSPGMKRLRKLPVGMQERHISQPVELLVSEDGESRILNVDVRNLSSSQAMQVFASDHVRSVAEQKAWLAEHVEKHPEPDTSEPYKIVKKKLTVIKPCTFTASQLAALLAELSR